VVLLDEIEKAHPDVFNIPLQVFEAASRSMVSTRSISRTQSSSTSNIGARHLQRREVSASVFKEEMVSEKSKTW
jgi:ATP-dependent Clp protease ATP-binding subunit ClpA